MWKSISKLKCQQVKSLAPVAFIAGAVVVTIKLLTTVTPENQEIIQVNAEEDIRTEEYTDPIEEPPAPPAPEEPQQEDQASEKEESEEEPEETTEDTAEDTEDQEEAEEEKNDEQNQEEKKEENQQPPALKWNGSDIAKTLSRLLSPKKQ